jgi:hypothetical protein
MAVSCRIPVKPPANHPLWVGTGKGEAAIMDTIILQQEVKVMQNVEILIKGQIDMHWSEWLGGLQISHVGQEQSKLAGSIADQATLYGILTKLRDLDMELVALNLKEGVHHA